MAARQTEPRKMPKSFDLSKNSVIKFKEFFKLKKFKQTNKGKAKI